MQWSLRHFIERLVGVCSSMKKMRNGDSMTGQFVIESKVGLGPSLTALQSNNQSMDSHINCLMKFAKDRQLEHQNTTMESQNSKGDGTYL